jgi:hypothetical protein
MSNIYIMRLSAVPEHQAHAGPRPRKQYHSPRTWKDFLLAGGLQATGAGYR